MLQASKFLNLVPLDGLFWVTFVDLFGVTFADLFWVTIA